MIIVTEHWLSGSSLLGTILNTLQDQSMGQHYYPMRKLLNYAPFSDVELKPREFILFMQNHPVNGRPTFQVLVLKCTSELM